jgi:hypothetical protein
MGEAATHHGYTVAEAARRYRVSPDKIRGWIARGELQAINTAAALCGKPRYVILPEHLEAFEQRRTVGQPAAPAMRRRRKSAEAAAIDYYP